MAIQEQEWHLPIAPVEDIMMVQSVYGIPQDLRCDATIGRPSHQAWGGLALIDRKSVV